MEFGLYLDNLGNRYYIFQRFAGVAQLVEHNLAKVSVAGSSPVSRSKKGYLPKGEYFFCFARVAELADARDLKSLGPIGPCRFESGPGHTKGSDDRIIRAFCVLRRFVNEMVCLLILSPFYHLHAAANSWLQDFRCGFVAW